MKSTILAGAALVLAGLALTSCDRESSEPAEAAPEGRPGVSVSDARLILPAVSGNPGVLYFDVIDNGDKPSVIRAADVVGAQSTSIHDTITTDGNTSMSESLPVNLPKGTTFKFEPGGKHVMVMGLDESLEAGGTTEVTITFLGGDKLSFPAEVKAAGDAR